MAFDLLRDQMPYLYYRIQVGLSNKLSFKSLSEILMIWFKKNTVLIPTPFQRQTAQLVGLT